MFLMVATLPIDPVVGALITLNGTLVVALIGFWKFIYGDAVSARQAAEEREMEMRRDILDILVPMVTTMGTLNRNSEKISDYITQLQTIALMQIGRQP